ncbi:Fur family transcriptional regulator, ferric uptake regulator [Paucidesulfovibrio gracilis DSM 16080]|uniref:Fur family transcriptional regulator, ferric uptake regulator n=1 Tax=Paucidesulfovibrio gracilis DSM 16080 TaxID=1121449 RepID=A0A1T4Y3Z5_9BACT|nr:transcriptional repressor [Paucidesulfovibrio gracilis]SKA96470.1 Fur family transcriptional regulator, ferric uptake regulator [Paucidesulfovibrio gracilis DSM 16080]
MSHATLRQAGVDPTARRVMVYEAVARAEGAVSAPDLLGTLCAHMNKVTLYRILDLLVEHGVVARHTGPERTAHYCLGRGHGHFHCTHCGRCICLRLEDAHLERLVGPELTGLGRVEDVELRVEGICSDCLKK